MHCFSQAVKESQLPNSLSESQLSKVWQYQLLDRTGLVTEEGEPIEVIYPGRLNDDQGADFRDAVIATNHGLMKGDIELHVKSSGWREHQHHRNAAYNRVILHVVMWHNTKTMTNLQNGREIPVLALQKYMKISAAELPNLASFPTALDMPCREGTQRLTADAIGGFLDSAGEERFFMKVARFQTDLAQTEASQCLYQGIMGALGYSKNKLPFLELAHRLPLKALASMAQSEISDEQYLAWQQALLLGTAGLLPLLRHTRYQANRWDGWWIDRLERLWSSSPHNGVMSPDAWHLFKVRPCNSPVRRLIAMSYLLLRYRESGILEGLVNLVRETSISEGAHKLEKGLLVAVDEHWAKQFDFASSRLRSLALLGSGRAADMVVNVLLPFTFAWGRFTSRSGLERQALDLYHCYPKLVANSIERHMTGQLGLSRRLVNSARRQQGLIHIYNTLCTQGRCNDCCLSQPEVGNYIQI